MGRGDADAEYWILATDEGQRLLREVEQVKSPGPALLSRWRRDATPEQVAAAIRLSSARTRGTSKFSRAQEMWLDPVGLEQATAELVARSKALRFASELVVDLCAGIGGDTIAFAHHAAVVAVDSDHGMCRRTQWNAQVYGLADAVTPVQAKAESLKLPAEALVHIDPDRRARPVQQGRARRVEDYAPGIDFLGGLPQHCRGGAVKLGPASDFSDVHSFASWEMELVSLRGECKEATAWFGELVTCRRRATVLPHGATWTDEDGPTNELAPWTTVDRWIFDPDPTLSRARLLDGFAVAHSLRRVAPAIDFLTAPAPIDSPFLSSFEVLETAPLDIKSLRRLVARHELGTLEIKTRGVSTRPEELRRDLRPEGPNKGTLLIWKGESSAQTVLARRRESASDTGISSHLDSINPLR